VSTTPTVTCYLESYGCQMNVNDSDILISHLRGDGYAMVDDPEAADVILLNTCSVRERAEERVLGRLWDLSRFRKQGRLRVLGVMGCMAQRTGQGLVDACREVDLVVGTRAFTRIPQHLETLLAGGAPVVDLEVVDLMPRIRLSSHPPRGRVGFVSIMRGCNRACTYCIVPALRGPEVYRTIDDVLDEVRALVAGGVREVLLLGQNVNSWREGTARFGTLLRRVNQVAGLEHIRFTTPHPRDFDADCLEAIAECEKVCEHLHMPLQSGSTEVLRRMVRGYTQETYLRLVARARERVPEVAITTDIIVGFPGETRAEFEETLHVVREVEYDAAFTFKFSPREGTKAADTADDVAPEVKAERLSRLNTLVKQIADRKNRALVGSTLPVVLEHIHDPQTGAIKGRTRTNKSVLVNASPAALGTIGDVTITAARGLMLHGELRGASVASA
jgi:tRNA-2-methylthio-N6-dimethylallyladenosine synthase